MNTDDQIITQDQLTFGHTIKDAPATCFVMLALAGGQARETWLARVTGYAAKTIHAAVMTLDVLGLAARIGQHKAWVLTSKASQLAAPLTFAESAADSEIQNRALLPVLPQEAEALLDDLLTGCPKKRAAPVIAAKLDEGMTVPEIEGFLSWWILYAESPLGAGIRGSPAQFAIAKLEAGEICPPFLHRRNEYDQRTGQAWQWWYNTNHEWINRLQR